MNEELKPCPDCGGYVHIEHAYDYLHDDIIICCDNCGIMLTVDARDKSLKDLVDKWNRRATDE